MRIRHVGVAALAAAAMTGGAGCQPMADNPAGGDANSVGVVRAWPYPVVWVEDHTGASWPVTTAVRQWDAGTAVSVRYGSCRANAGCIRVYEVDWGDNGKAGRTQMRWFGHRMTSATVRLNDYYASTAFLRLVTACHEIGHGLGLPHSASRESCLYPRTYEARTAAPDAHDRAELNTAWRAEQTAKAGSR